jgi:hypothetical protein
MLIQQTEESAWFVINRLRKNVKVKMVLLKELCEWQHFLWPET